LKGGGGERREREKVGLGFDVYQKGKRRETRGNGFRARKGGRRKKREKVKPGGTSLGLLFTATMVVGGRERDYSPKKEKTKEELVNERKKNRSHGWGRRH